MEQIRLGLIGDNIRASKSPLLHRVAGELCGLDITYDLLIPAERRLGFDALFDRCREEGYRGLNVTYPYKEQVLRRVEPDDTVRALGACNTVCFDGVARGYNTDHTGFVSAFRRVFPERRPGRVALAGAGGVGKAIAFGLTRLGAETMAIFDLDRPRAERLAAAVRERHPVAVTVAPSIDDAVRGADGLVNCTPLGMDGIPGTPIPADLIRAPGWAFDAIYTPVDTMFLTAARAAGLVVMSGIELLLDQGVDAFRLFTGREVNPAALRAALAAEQG